MSKPYDATFKDLIAAFPADWLGFVGVPLSGPVEVLSPELSTVTSAADALVRVGDEVIHFDAESGPDPDLPVRVGLYNLLTHRHTGLPVHSVVVLLRPKAGVAGRRDGFGYSPRPRGRLTFEYETVRVWERPAEELLNGVIGLAPLATIARPPRGRRRADVIPEYIGRIGERAVTELSREMALRVGAISLILGGMYTSRDRLREASQRMPSMIQSSAWELFQDQAAESLLRETLFDLATDKFGPPTAEQQVKAEAIHDVSRIRRLLRRIRLTDTWDALLRGR